MTLEGDMRQSSIVRGAAACAALAVLGIALHATQAKPQPPAADARLEVAYRKPARNGWTVVHLQGTPAAVGYQHGYLLAAEIADTLAVIKLESEHDNKRDWAFFRDAAQKMMWPKIEAEYREELQGIADGARAKGVTIDVWDVVAMNASLEWSYYVKELDKQQGKTDGPRAVAERCSAFVATGSYTADGKAVIAHNNWSSYLDGARWTIVFDLVPARGHRILMDGLPGLIHSGDDFGINAAGIAITETTISQFSGFDPAGIPEFVRARKAMQYSASIDDFARIMKEGNNGGYANDWLIADTRQNEIAHLELGLKNVTLERTTDGYFVGSNFPKNPTLVREETGFDPTNLSVSANARRVRWEQLMTENKGRIDLAAAQRFESDHYDSFAKKDDPNERSLCGHVDRSPRGMEPWVGPFGVAGTVQNKAATASMIATMTLTAAAGHACGIGFKAADHLAAHPEFAWQKPLLRDLPAGTWTTFAAAR
jgi:hypothetical protein